MPKNFLNRGKSLRRKIGWLSGLGLALIFLGGCKRAQSSAASADHAHVMVVNLSDYEWQITVTSKKGGQASASRLSARASLKVDLPAGDYVIEQTALAKNMSEATRHFDARLESGLTYRWRLATLLSATETARP
jgi:hypothetical protein